MAIIQITCYEAVGPVSKAIGLILDLYPRCGQIGLISTRPVIMPLFDFLSDDSECEETEAYLNSLADHFEGVLEEEFEIDIEGGTGKITDQATVLFAYIVFSNFSGRRNPNVDTDCELKVGRVKQGHLQKWSAAAHSEDAESQLLEAGAKAALTDLNYKEIKSIPNTFVLKRLEKVDENKIDNRIVERTNFELAKIKDAEVRFLKAVDTHDRTKNYEEWIQEWILFDKSELYARRIAEKIWSHLAEYGLGVQEDNLDRADEVAAGIFYLSCQPFLHAAVKSGNFHLRAATIKLRELLTSDIPTEAGLIDAEYHVLIESFESEGSRQVTAEVVDAISSWAACYHNEIPYRPTKSHMIKAESKRPWRRVTKSALGFASEMEVDIP